MSRYSDVDGLGHYQEHPSFYTNEKEQERIEEGLYMATCEAVTDAEIDQWLDEMELEKTDDNIDKAVNAIALHKLGWDN